MPSPILRGLIRTKSITPRFIRREDKEARLAEPFPAKLAEPPARHAEPFLNRELVSRSFVSGEPAARPAAPRPRSLLRSQARCALASGATPRVRAEPHRQAVLRASASSERHPLGSTP